MDWGGGGGGGGEETRFFRNGQSRKGVTPESARNTDDLN